MGNTLDDPWKSDKKFCSSIAQSHGIGQKPEKPVPPNLKLRSDLRKTEN